MSANDEATLLEWAADGAADRRRVARGDRRWPVRRAGPVDRGGARLRRRCDARGRDRRARRRGRGAGRVGGDRAAEAVGDPPRRLAADAGPQGRPRAADDARDGQAARRGGGRGRVRVGVLPLVRGGGGADHGAVRHQPGGHGAHDRLAAPGRAVLLHHPLELPARDGDPQDRAGARGGLHRRGEAGGADAAHDAADGDDPGGGGAAGRRAERRADDEGRRAHRADPEGLRASGSSASRGRPRSGSG